MKYTESEWEKVNDDIWNAKSEIAHLRIHRDEDPTITLSEYRVKTFKRFQDIIQKRQDMMEVETLARTAASDPALAAVHALSSKSRSSHRFFFEDILPKIDVDDIDQVLTTARRSCMQSKLPSFLCTMIESDLKDSHLALVEFLNCLTQKEFLATEEFGNTFMHHAAMWCIDNDITWLTLKTYAKFFPIAQLCDAKNHLGLIIRECLWAAAPHDCEERKAFHKTYDEIISRAKATRCVVLAQDEEEGDKEETVTEFIHRHTPASPEYTPRE